MTQCIPQQRLSFHPEAPVVVEFNAPEISSDGGALLLRQIDDRLGLTAGFADCLLEDRERHRVRHSRQEQTRQRIFQIALGYEDCNDADRLRLDPLLNVVCDRARKGSLLSRRSRVSKMPSLPQRYAAWSACLRTPTLTTCRLIPSRSFSISTQPTM